MSRSISLPALLAALAVLAWIGCSSVDAAPDAHVPLDAARLGRQRGSGAIDAPARRDAGLHANAFAIVPHGTQLTMRAGTARPMIVELIRADGFDTPIVLTLHGLPDGLRASPRTAGPIDRYVVLLVEASDGAVTQERVPFALQAEADGWVRRARITVSVTR